MLRETKETPKETTKAPTKETIILEIVKAKFRIAKENYENARNSPGIVLERNLALYHYGSLKEWINDTTLEVRETTLDKDFYLTIRRINSQDIRLRREELSEAYKLLCFASENLSERSER
jgi:hypothetical protein